MIAVVYGALLQSFQRRVWWSEATGTRMCTRDPKSWIHELQRAQDMGSRSTVNGSRIG